MESRVYLFAFTSAAHARIFVQKLVLQLEHLAIYIDGESVIVIDGGEEPRRERILQLAKWSSAVRAGVG